MEPRFIIFVETTSGEVIRAFTWSRDEQTGIACAHREAMLSGHTPARVWAEEIKTANA